MTESIIPFSVLKMLADTARAAPPGNFVEVGVFRGGSAQILYNIARNQDSDSKLREVHLFDTFTGIPFADAIDRHQPGEFNGGSSLEHLRRAMPDAFFHVGIFPETMPPDLCRIAFAHIDCDQYKSVHDCIEHLWPRMVPNGIMWFDDVGVLPGAWKAAHEFFAEDELLHAPESRRYTIKRSIG